MPRPLPSILRRATPPASGLLLAALVAGAGVGQELPRPPLPAATHGPVRIAFARAGDRAAVTEGDTGTLAVVDTAAARVLRRFPTGGQQPLGLALTADGGALVANSLSGSVTLLDLGTGLRRALLPLRGEPSEVVLSRDGTRAYVSLAQLDEIAVLDLPGLQIRRRVPVAKRPRAMALTSDGASLVVAGFQAGELSVVDTGTLRETRRIPLTGVNLRGVALAENGHAVYVTGQIPANSRATAEPLDIWTNTLFLVDLQAPANSPTASLGRGAAEGWLDFSLGASPDPDGIAVLGEERVAVTLSGADQALLVRTPGPHLRTYDPVIEQRTAVGAHPRGVALTPDRRRLWVANELGGTLSILDAATLRRVGEVALGTPSRRDLRLEGRYLFGNAALTQGGQFTCNSCHPEGGTDGLTWEFVHVPDGLERRNSRSLRGDITLTAPFRWSGHDSDIEEFFQEEIAGLLHGPRQEHPALHALWNLLDQYPLPPNPYREEDGGLTPAARRGKALFEGKAGCASCHEGEFAGGSGRRAHVGTTVPGLDLDVPHLRGVYDSAPYLHDGRAATLEEVFTRYNTEKRHGQAHRLSGGELADLLRYVREL